MMSGLIIRVQSREAVEFGLLTLIKNLLFLDLSVTDYDELIKSVADRAIDDVERFTGLAIGPQTRKISYSILTETAILPYRPFIETVSVDTGGLVDDDGRLTAIWPAGGSVTVKCGYDETNVPAGLLTSVALAAAEYSGLNASTIKRDGWKDSARRYRTFTWAS